jgi:hypothetical protein
MLKRLILGLILGTVIGAVLAAVLVQGLGMLAFPNAFVAYLAAGATGIITGLVAGKPIWSADGKIEAGLKAFFGVLLAVGGMFALRSWANVHLDLSMLKAGAGYLGSLPAASLPIIAAVLAAFYEVDNSPSLQEKGEEVSGAELVASKASMASKKGAGNKVRVGPQADAAEADEADDTVARKRGR